MAKNDKIAEFKFDLVPDMEALEQRMAEVRRRVGAALDQGAPARGRSQMGGTSVPRGQVQRGDIGTDGRARGGSAVVGETGAQRKARGLGGGALGALGRFAGPAAAVGLTAGTLIGGARAEQRQQREVAGTLTQRAEQSRMLIGGAGTQAAMDTVARDAALESRGGVRRFAQSVLDFGANIAGAVVPGMALGQDLLLGDESPRARRRARQVAQAEQAANAAAHMQDELLDRQTGGIGAVGTRIGGPLQATGAAGRVETRELLKSRAEVQAAQVVADQHRARVESFDS